MDDERWMTKDGNVSKVRATDDDSRTNERTNSGGMARMLSGDLLGTTIEAIYHTGVVVHGKEYWFGCGLQCAPAGRAQSQFGTPMRVERLGETEVDVEIWEAFLRDVAPRYTPETYNLLEHNCNNFSNEAAEFLVGRSIPEKILNLPRVVLETELGRALRPMLGMFEHRMRNTVGTNISAEVPTAQNVQEPKMTSQQPRAEPNVSGLGGVAPLPAKKIKTNPLTSSSPTPSDAEHPSTTSSASASSVDIVNMVRSLSQTFGELRERGASSAQATASVLYAAKDALENTANEP
jgi:hypothetical protein